MYFCTFTIDLKRIRDEKLKELKAKKEELQKSDASFEKSETGSLCINICHKVLSIDCLCLSVLKVISQMEEIWKLQNKDPDNLNQISSEFIQYTCSSYILMGKMNSKISTHVLFWFQICRRISWNWLQN